MNYLKITSKGWRGYNGVLGRVIFKDGVSTEPVPRHLADRLSGLIAFVEQSTPDAKEGTPAGIAHRLVIESADRIPVLPALERQTEGERAAEAHLDALRAQKAPTQTFYNRQQLVEIADEKGMKGLRSIGDAWNVKHRSIETLIELILEAQARWLEKRKKNLDQTSARKTMALTEFELAKEKAEELARLEQEEADRIAATMVIPEHMQDRHYVADEREISGNSIVIDAWKRTGRTLTGWNRMDADKRNELIEAEIALKEKELGVDLVLIEPIADKKTEKMETKTVETAPKIEVQDLDADAIEIVKQTFGDIASTVPPTGASDGEEQSS